MAIPAASASNFYMAFDPEFDPEKCPMRFRLTYEGRLESSGNRSGKIENKHEIRRQLHPQLRRLWEVEPNLSNWRKPEDGQDYRKPDSWTHVKDILTREFTRGTYSYVPLVTREIALSVSLEILLLRTARPGGIISSGDIDGRLKTLFDGLAMPSSLSQLGTYQAPASNENPFYVLLEDDSLITHVAVQTDLLL
jgi:hypothetical protein